MAKKAIVLLVVALLIMGTAERPGGRTTEEAPLSQETQGCLGCHRLYTPGIVADWESSRHSRTTPAEALAKPELERRISASKVPEALAKVAVGCYECHGQNPERHQDNFEHFGYRINVIVSPGDCATCHPAEVEQFSGSKKAHAVGNLKKNPVYSALVETITSLKAVEEGRVIAQEASDYTKWETCYACHGTEVRVAGTEEVETPLGKITMPKLEGWPNQGVGRLNPDGTMGSCAACHPRHGFSIEVARKPYTCAQCHLDPDVPAWNVYKESKHGNILLSASGDWDWKAVPWRVGQDFRAPSCAACHNSLIVDGRGNVIAERTHDFGARLWTRLFGLIYSHPQPREGDTSIIRNADGLPLPTTFAGEPAGEYLIDKREQARRLAVMENVCRSCHSTPWVRGHFAKLENTTKETDKMVLAATQLLQRAWAEGLADQENPFDEELEQLWVKQWLFYANSVRYASAMSGAPDYATFKHGWWELTANLEEMETLLKQLEGEKGR